jgi:hypothetical protein
MPAPQTPMEIWTSKVSPALRPTRRQRPNYAVLLNPWVWLFDSPLYAPRYCLDCRGALAVGGIVFAAIVIAAAVFVAILLW